ncbi:MAG: hypothetical protein E7152_02815 [Enterococcus casseliflavus]|nr:hypothetical protein [Enterococcus casseliflavus]
MIVPFLFMGNRKTSKQKDGSIATEAKNGRIDPVLSSGGLLKKKQTQTSRGSPGLFDVFHVYTSIKSCVDGQSPQSGIYPVGGSIRCIQNSACLLDTRGCEP